MTSGGVVVQTGSVVDTMSTADAERITLRISLKLDTMADAYQGVMPLIRDAIEREAWRVLGYNSVSSWAEERFSGALTRLGMDARKDVVRELEAAGLSSRAIAPVVGISDRQIRRDMAGGTQVPPEVKFDSAMASMAEFMTNHPLTTAAPTVGRDGKTYARHEPKQSKRRPIDDGFREVSLDLGKVVKRVEKLACDDRVAHAHGRLNRYANDLLRASEALAQAAQLLTNSES